MVEVASASPSYSRGCRIERYRGARTGGTAEHSINTGGLKFTAFSKNQKHTFSTYASAQHIVRNSYYSAYGMTTDFTGVLGAQYIYHFDKCLFMPADLTGGIEFNHTICMTRQRTYRSIVMLLWPKILRQRVTACNN